jgi:hypothetical protein
VNCNWSRHSTACSYALTYIFTYTYDYSILYRYRMKSFVSWFKCPDTEVVWVMKYNYYIVIKKLILVINYLYVFIFYYSFLHDGWLWHDIYFLIIPFYFFNRSDGKLYVLIVLRPIFGSYLSQIKLYKGHIQ